MSTPESVVRDFCAAFSRLDLKEILGFLAEDAVYHNIPMAPVKGTEAIEGVLNGFIGPASAAEFELLAISSNGPVVLTERIDRFTIGEKQLELPVMGAFEVSADGKISAWRDYFDLNQFTQQMS